MIENAVDNYVESKPSNVECSIELNLSIVKAYADTKPSIKASIDVQMLVPEL